MSTIAFGSSFSFITAATPSTGWIIGYDNDGILKQKDKFGIITEIGGGPTAGSSATYSLAQVLLSGNNTNTRSIIMGTSTHIRSINGGGRIEFDRLGVTNSILLSTDSSVGAESGLILRRNFTSLYSNSNRTFVEFGGNGNNLALYSTNGGEITLGIHNSTTVYGELDDFKLAFNTSATVSTGNYNKKAIFVGSKNSKISNGVVNTVVIGGEGFTASNSNSVYVPDIYIQKNKAIRSTDSNDVFYLSDTNGDTYIDKSGNFDKSWFRMSENESGYDYWSELIVNSSSGLTSGIIIQNKDVDSISNLTSILLEKQSLSFLTNGPTYSINFIINPFTNTAQIQAEVGFKGLEYNNDFSDNYSTYSLVTKQYVDSQFSNNDLDSVLSIGNNSGSYDIEMGVSTVIKSAQGGGQLDLDFSGSANEVVLSNDNGNLLQSYIYLTSGDIQISSPDSISLGSDTINVTTNDNEGIKYSASYEATFVTQSLVNKGYVDSGTNSIWQAIDSINGDFISEIITGTGLTGGGTSGTLNIDINLDNGIEFIQNSVGIGGTLSQNTTIKANNFDFKVQGASEINVTASNTGLATNNLYLGDFFALYGSNSSGSWGVSGNTYGSTLTFQDSLASNSTLSVDTTKAFIRTDDGASLSSQFVIYKATQTIGSGDSSSDNRMIIRDDWSSKGLVYFDDYSSNFTTYSLITKGYVDNAVSSSVNIYNSDGNFNSDRNIFGNTNYFYFDTNSSGYTSSSIGSYIYLDNTYAEISAYAATGSILSRLRFLSTQIQSFGSFTIASGIFDVGGSVIYADSNPLNPLNPLVGINNSSPSYTLHVLGTVSTTGFIMTNGASSGYILQSDAFGNATWVAPYTGVNKYSTMSTFTASVTQSISHNLNTEDIIVQTYDSTGLQIIPGSIQVNGTSSVDIMISSSLSNVKIVLIG